MDQRTKQKLHRDESQPTFNRPFPRYKYRLHPSLFMGYIKRYTHYLFECPRYKDRLGPTTFSLYCEDRDRQVWRAGKIWQDCTKREGRVQQDNTITL